MVLASRTFKKVSLLRSRRFLELFPEGSQVPPPEPQELADARLFLAQLTDPSERDRMGRVLCRMKRRWYAAVARERFARSAMSALRDDAKSSHRVSWMYKKLNERSYNSLWGTGSPVHLSRVD